MRNSVSLTIVLVFLLVFSYQNIAAEELPPPVAAIEKQGVRIIEKFTTANGIVGYVAEADQRPFVIYLLEDGEHAIVGTLVDSEGNDLTRESILTYAQGSVDAIRWNAIEESAWVADGTDDAEMIVYTFTDPNCRHCHDLWEKLRPWVAAGKVQLRHILVGITKKSSRNKAAAILAAEDPASALNGHEKDFDKGGIEPLADIPESIEQALTYNTELMQGLEVTSTPTFFYMDAEKSLKRFRGVPELENFDSLFGSL
ncbi:MAG: thiol:disulfide interchange protein DsbG [Gammaproteobacteria bacterium]